MQTKMIGVSTIALLLVACAPNSVSTEGQRARIADGAKVELRNREGKKVGTLTVSVHSSGGVQINGPITDLPPGGHGLHIHETGECKGPDFESAGAHFNPFSKQHGELNPEGPHAGDLGNIRIETNGTAQLSLLADRVTLTDAPNSLLKPGGTSILIQSTVDSVQQRLSSFARSAVEIAIQLAICLFTLFYFFRDRKRILTAARTYLPLSAPEFDDISARIGTMIQATIYGTVVVAAVQGALGGVMFWILGLPAPLLWGVAMTVAAIIPVLGAFVVWAPAALYLLAQGEIWKAIILAAFGLIIISLADNLLYPILVGKELRIHTLLVFLALLGGIAVFGMSGIVLGPVALAVTLGLLDILRQRTVAGRPAEQPR